MLMWQVQVAKVVVEINLHHEVVHLVQVKVSQVMVQAVQIGFDIKRY